MPICRLIRITCHEQEDYTGKDHPYITVNGKHVWGPTGMEEGETREIRSNYRFPRRAWVRLYEQDDYESDDFLGEHIITRTDVGQGEREYTFAEDGANYSIWIEVFDDPGR